MTAKQAFVGASLFDGHHTRQNMALVLSHGSIEGIVAANLIDSTCQVVALDGGTLIPGYVDLQVNGGGGVLLNDCAAISTIERICRSHVRFGTTALLPTLITDTPQVTSATIDAVTKAQENNVPGLLGLHLEGPFICSEKRGAHDAQLVRSMTAMDLALFIEASQNIENLMVTLSPQAVSDDQISQLAKAGVVVSLGHSTSSYWRAQSAVSAGARCVTHLFNAMTPFAHREPGLVGAALSEGALYAGLIADGFHVEPAAISIALAAKKKPGRLFLVTDAMSTIGTSHTQFMLNGRSIKRANGRLTLEDGTLAGADLDMHSAVLYMHRQVGLDFEESVRMATVYPAQCLGVADTHGSLAKGCRGDFIHLSDDRQIRRVWIGGDVCFSAEGED